MRGRRDRRRTEGESDAERGGEIDGDGDETRRRFHLEGEDTD